MGTANYTGKRSPHTTQKAHWEVITVRPPSHPGIPIKKETPTGGEESPQALGRPVGMGDEASLAEPRVDSKEGTDR